MPLSEVSVGFRAGHDTCCSEISCTTRTRLCDASATARWNSRDERVKATTSSILPSASTMSSRSRAWSSAVELTAASSAARHSMARCASMISLVETPARSSCTASASANRRALPWAMRAPPPDPTLMSTTPWASSVRSASRATMRLTPKRPAKSFSVPRKSPGRNSRANSASRTCATICVDMVAERKGRTFRSLLFMAGCSRIWPLRVLSRLKVATILKIISFASGRVKGTAPASARA